MDAGGRAFSTWGNIQHSTAPLEPFISRSNISYIEKACENYVIIAFFAEHLVGDKGRVLRVQLGTAGCVLMFEFAVRIVATELID